MSIQRAEELKREWTDQHVTVRRGVPELRRFEGFVGQVRTVNMNCRALVEFDGSADIGWYDIDPQFLVLAERETNKKSSTAGSHERAEGKAPASKTSAPTVSASSSRSPLDEIRAQSSAQSTPVANAKASARSPLDQIRAQTAAKGEDSAKVTKSPSKGATPTSGAAAGLSPLDQIRSQAGTAAAAETSSKATGSVARLSPLAPLADSHNSSAQSETTSKGVRKIFDVGSAPPVPSVSAPLPTTSIPAPLELLERQGIRSGTSASSSAASVNETDHAPRDLADFPDSGGSASVLNSESDDETDQTFVGRALLKPDDLTVVEGIGPRIEELLKAAGISSWKILSDTDPSRIREVLTDAGSRFKMHDPSTWPHQAQLAYEGRWKELEEYQDLLDGGRES